MLLKSTSACDKGGPRCCRLALTSVPCHSCPDQFPPRSPHADLQQHVAAPGLIEFTLTITLETRHEDENGVRDYTYTIGQVDLDDLPGIRTAQEGHATIMRAITFMAPWTTFKPSTNRPTFRISTRISLRRPVAYCKISTWTCATYALHLIPLFSQSTVVF